ncbi:retinol-binding protein 3 [Denticeps clupeoides]|uniref:Tail specific protease domain-containing protein n=1 Tax=Denticeps clupeoides TaxID=299321 RepID=A0AAY4CU82_9TELE|nr:retinol-binding protein 3-like [Denticeps clupeoides]
MSCLPILLLASLGVFSTVFVTCDAFPPALIMDMAKILLDNYCSPEKLAGMEEAIEAATSNTEILSIPDPNALAGVLSEGVKNTIYDSRVVVTYEPNYVPIKSPALPALLPEQMAAMLQGSIKVEVLDSNVGYMKIQHIIGEEMAQQIGPQLIEMIWDKLLPTSALILDFRYTGSGDLTGIPYIVSYFTDPEPLIHIDTIYDRSSNTTTNLMSMPALMGKRYGTTKPLILLTSQNTKGVAEDVAYSLKNLKRATIVGEKTAGGSVKIEKFKLGDSDFYVTVPVAKSTSPITGKSWEIVGVTPDVEVLADDALDAAVEILSLRSEIPSLLQDTGTVIAENYAFEDIAADVAEKLAGLAASGEYDTINSKEELLAKLSSDLVKLSGDKGLSAIPSPPPPLVNPSPEMLVQLIKLSFQTDVFENNIGYLRFDQFGDFEQVAVIAKIIVEHVWNKVVDTDALIVDLRYNLGGYTTALPGFCSYFFDNDKEIVLDKIYDRPSGTTHELVTLSELTGTRYGGKKGLVILSSGQTAGAAEEFIFIMKRLGRAMIIGETTLGGFQPPKTFRIGESDVYLSVPTAHSDTTMGPGWEGAGIIPHIPVSAEAALNTAKGILNKQFGGQK